MSLIGDILFEVVGQLVGSLLGRLFHATGRRLIFLFSFGRIRIPAESHGGGGDGADAGAVFAGLVFWVAAIAATIYLLVT